MADEDHQAAGTHAADHDDRFGDDNHLDVGLVHHVSS